MKTKQTNRFALCFFLYFMLSTTGIALWTASASLPTGLYLMVGQLAAFVPPILFYFAVTKQPVAKTLRLHPLSLKNILLILGMAVAIQPLISLLSLISSFFFPNLVEDTMTEVLETGPFLALLSVAVIPAFAEEFSTRGILLSGYENLGRWKSFLACGLMFSLMHMNPQQFLYTFATGVLFCFLVERTDSIFASVLPHFLINGGTVAAVFYEAAQSSLAELPVSEISSRDTLFILIGAAILSVPALLLLVYLFLKNNPQKRQPVHSAANIDPDILAEQYPEENFQLILPKERFFTLPVLAVLVLYFIFGFLPFLGQ